MADAAITVRLVATSASTRVNALRDRRGRFAAPADAWRW